MARTRNDLGAKAEAQIKGLMARGGTAASIAKALRAAGVAGASERTVGRRMRELRGAVAPRASRARRAPAPEAPSAPPRAVRATPPLPPTAEEIPEDTDLETIVRWIEIADRMGRDAEVDGNLHGVGAMGRLTSALLEAKRKATPVAKPDPNESPDMRALAVQLVERLHLLVDQVVVP